MSFLDRLSIAAATDRSDARAHPVAFLIRDFARLAAIMALTLAVFDALTFDAPMLPTERLKVIIGWSAAMAIVSFLIRRRLASNVQAHPQA